MQTNTRPVRLDEQHRNYGPKDGHQDEKKTFAHALRSEGERTAANWRGSARKSKVGAVRRVFGSVRNLANSDCAHISNLVQLLIHNRSKHLQRRRSAQSLSLGAYLHSELHPLQWLAHTDPARRGDYPPANDPKLWADSKRHDLPLRGDSVCPQARIDEVVWGYKSAPIYQ